MRNRLLSSAVATAVAVLFTISAYAQGTAPAATFAANAASLGAIPDATTTGPGAFGAPRDVTFTVSGLTGNVTSVSVNFNASHTFVGDLDVVLKAPGGAPSLGIFSRTGAATATSFGSGSDLAAANLYNFTDTAATNWWTAAATTPIPAGDYRTTVAGPTTSPAAVTSLNAIFAGLTPAQANGTWTLTFRDGASGDTGTVTAANLTINTGGTAVTLQHVVDYDGDGKTDWSVVRNTGGGANGQVTWFNQFNGSAGGSTVAFGLAGDHFVPADYDGDSRTDISVWRPGASGTAAWYTLLSGTNTLRS
ncbi:MAG: hypothetical protein ACR2IH_12455, partial [Pyrinomonadaceae bacterium]